MDGRVLVAPTSRPRFLPQVVFRYDKARERWVVLGPERLWLPDDMAVEILKCCDGTRDVAAIAGALATRFEADRAVVEQDVTAIVQDLADKGVMAA